MANYKVKAMIKQYVQKQVQIGQTRVDYVKLIFFFVFIVAIIGVAIFAFLAFAPKKAEGIDVCDSSICQDRPTKSIGVQLQGDAASNVIIVAEDYQFFEQPMNWA